MAGLIAVGLGAFGAHAIGDGLNAKQAQWWQTATFYLLTHAIAGLAIALSEQTRRFAIAGILMVIGAAIFAATLYAMALGGPTWLGAITPIGGSGMIAGWALIVITSLRSR